MDTQTSHEFSACPLREHSAELFENFVERYGEIVQLSVLQTVSGTDRHVFAKLRTMAWQAGEHDAVPQDLIAIHLAALSTIVKTKPQAMVRASIRQSRLLLVKMIGELALYYRDHRERR